MAIIILLVCTSDSVCGNIVHRHVGLHRVSSGVLFGVMTLAHVPLFKLLSTFTADVARSLSGL